MYTAFIPENCIGERVGTEKSTATFAKYMKYKFFPIVVPPDPGGPSFEQI
jgi:hypothetical protein